MFLPSLGQVPISDITPQLAIQTLKPLERKGNLEALRRLCQRLNEIMKFARNSGFISFNVLTDIKEAFKKPKVENMKTISPEELPAFLSVLFSCPYSLHNALFD